MKDFRLALIQHDSYVGHKAENLERAVSWIEQAKKSGADLICLPELNISGHAGHISAVKESEPVPEGPSVHALVEIARRLGVYICAGIVENDLGIHYNTQFMVGPDGYIGKQRKLHLSLDEYFYFRGGSQIKIFELPFARIGIIICYDNLFPEISRVLALKGAEVLLCPHATRDAFGTVIQWLPDPDYRKDIIKRQKAGFTRIHSCRAYDNGCYVAVCNMTGQSAKDLDGVTANHSGVCMVFDPKGDLIAESTSEDMVDEMVIVDLQGSKIDDLRAACNFNLKIRKPELFGLISQPTE